ncbi:MAG: bifunctional DNA-formamidopyrimidine glycosylase/DNA-(apurinic or apyrimidinic site) lyase [Parvularculaceae bacterium]|nr:bifunctional DNA-formamidopyrimidine glycosylase/DNA-(apurinic or apyrimidinic site) lyase [Parvularculaceae bacterium]
MPELPEVETVRRGLEPVLAGAKISAVHLARPDLRFPFPERFGDRLKGATIERVDRRAKFLVMPLSTGEVLTAHLGMTGRFRVEGLAHEVEPGRFYAPTPPTGHDHVEIALTTVSGDDVALIYSDPRRFGFMELFGSGEFEGSGRMVSLGPEPLGNEFSASYLVDVLRDRSTPMKSALLDQSVVAGLGNIYVCEALFIAGISPRRQAKSLGAARAERLVPAIRGVLNEAIAAGGSTLRDYVAADGKLGSFQQSFRVYDREGQACGECGSTIKRMVQSGRSTFFCSRCQR